MFLNNRLRKALILTCTIVFIHSLVIALAGLRPSNPPHQQGLRPRWTPLKGPAGPVFRGERKE